LVQQTVLLVSTAAREREREKKERKQERMKGKEGR
jgi:hypothetical protein